MKNREEISKELDCINALMGEVQQKVLRVATLLGGEPKPSSTPQGYSVEELIQAKLDRKFGKPSTKKATVRAAAIS